MRSAFIMLYLSQSDFDAKGLSSLLAAWYGILVLIEIRFPSSFLSFFPLPNTAKCHPLCLPWEELCFLCCFYIEESTKYNHLWNEIKLLLSEKIRKTLSIIHLSGDPADDSQARSRLLADTNDTNERNLRVRKILGKCNSLSVLLQIEMIV